MQYVTFHSCRVACSCVVIDHKNSSVHYIPEQIHVRQPINCTTATTRPIYVHRGGVENVGVENEVECALAGELNAHE